MAREFRCQRGGPLKKRGRGGQPAPRLRPAGRPLKLGGDVLVGAGGSLGEMPGAPVGIGLARRSPRANAWCTCRRSLSMDAR